jgi:ABC-type antimicrobial peptide transport system permease subunit
MDKDAYVLGAHRLDDLVYDSAWRVNYAAQLSAGLAAVSLLLAAIGIYGVSSHAVRERTREIGLRMALGARARHVTILVLKSMTIAAGTGLVSGLIASCFLTTSLRALLFGIDPFDAVTFAMTAVLLAATTLVAAAVPLWRALGLPPLVALRHGS